MKSRSYRYIMFNKPYGVLCAFTDRETSPASETERDQSSNLPSFQSSDANRPTLASYILVPGVYPAGRLDLDSEGLVLLTDDGWLVHRLSHPRYHQPKTYLVQVEQVPTPQALDALRRGVPVKGEVTSPARVQLLPSEPALPPRAVPIRERKTIPTAWLRIVLTEGRKRQIRHMTAAAGYPTLRLVRIAIGPLELGDLPPGEWRGLTRGELSALMAAVRSPQS